MHFALGGGGVIEPHDHRIAAPLALGGQRARAIAGMHRAQEITRGTLADRHIMRQCLRIGAADAPARGVQFLQIGRHIAQPQPVGDALRHIDAAIGPDHDRLHRCVDKQRIERVTRLNRSPRVRPRPQSDIHERRPRHDQQQQHHPRRHGRAGREGHDDGIADRERIDIV